MKKWIYGGGAALFLGWLAWRRWRSPAVSASTQPALSGPSYLWDGPRMILAVRSQVSAAKAGKALSDYLKAEDRSLFFPAPAYDATAFLTGAYWMAVAARITGDDTLRRKASTYLSKGEQTFALPGSSFMDSNVVRILQGAIDALQPFATERGVAGILAALGNQRQADVVQTRQAERVSPTVETMQRAGGDLWSLVSDASLWLRDGIGLDRPDGSAAPWWRKWLVRGGVAVAALVALRIAFAPQYKAAKAMLAPVARVASAQATKARALLAPPSTPSPRAPESS